MEKEAWHGIGPDHFKNSSTEDLEASLRCVGEFLDEEYKEKIRKELKKRETSGRDRVREMA